MILFEGIVFTAAFVVIYLYWNTLSFVDTSPTKEGFMDSSSLQNITMCPGTSKSFVAKNGDTLCCDGNPAGTECEGKTICTLSSSSSLPSCAAYLNTLYARKGVTFCPESLPQYFEDELGRKFCTNGTLNKELNGTSASSSERCSIGKGFKDPTSCEVLVALERMSCPSDGCTKSAQAFPEEPVVLTATFRDSAGMTHTCYDTESLSNLWRFKYGPDWKSKMSHIDFDTNINFCDVAKKYYIDKTLSQTQIQI